MKKFLFVVICGLLVLTTVNVQAKENMTESIGTTSATIKGNNYVIDNESKTITVTSNANIEVSGNAEDYKLVVDNNAKNVKITKNNYTAITGGWADTIGLKENSEAEIILVGQNTLQVGNEASAIRVPEGTTLTISGEGTLSAKISNGNSAASSAVIGSAYNYPFGDIIINSGTIYTSYTGGGQITGIGSGYWYFDVECKGTITLNGGVIHTDVIGNPAGKTNIFLKGSNKAVVYVNQINANQSEFNGIIFDGEGKNGTVIGNVELVQDIEIPTDGKLEMPKDSTLTVKPNVTIINNGQIINNGKIVNKGLIQNNNKIENNGEITSATEINNVDGNEIKPIIYVITVNVGKGGNIDKEKVTTINYGEEYTTTITPNKGYKIKSITVNDVDYTSKVIDNKLTLSNIESNLTINIEFEKNQSIADNPETSDNLFLYLSTIMISLIGIAGTTIYLIKNKGERL